MHKSLNKLETEVIKFFKKKGLIFLRFSLVIVFIWFGTLKTIGLSPAQELVTNTIYWFNPSWFVPFLGWWEILIGICLLYKPFIKLGLVLLGLQMVGTLLPLILLPEIVYAKFPFILTLEGQYIIKNIVLITAAMVIGSHIRDENQKNY